MTSPGQSGASLSRREFVIGTVVSGAAGLLAAADAKPSAQRFLADDNVDLDEVREILNDIVTQDQRAGEVIHGLRLLLKKGELQEHVDGVDLNEVILDVVNLMRSDLINRNVTLDTDLAQKLPAYMIPSAFVQMGELPLTRNGKLDRDSLPPPEITAASGEEQGYGTAVEEIIAGIWSQVASLQLTCDTASRDAQSCPVEIGARTLRPSWRGRWRGRCW